MLSLREYIAERIRNGMCQEDAWAKEDNIYAFSEEIDALSNFDLLEYIEDYIEENYKPSFKSEGQKP